ncbi:hypothetical protein [Planococcus donghaensis]|uniref:hypothetical protein n=1 Tax=Planococcus donghaensis TaxID=414778 RepID=UPI001ED9306B|nr:hypothetical protein [Planococcus donghaensis]
MSVPRARWMVLLLFSVGLMAGCSATSENLVVQGVSNARDAFEAEPKSDNEKIGQTALYVPNGYVIEELQDDFNGLITNGGDSFSLAINPNEKATSTLFYDLQKVNPKQLWLVDEKFRQNGRFGFVTVTEIAEDKLELVVGAGGVKMTTISTENDFPKNIDWMMKTVRSVELDE